MINFKANRKVRESVSENGRNKSSFAAQATAQIMPTVGRNQMESCYPVVDLGVPASTRYCTTFATTTTISTLATLPCVSNS